MPINKAQDSIFDSSDNIVVDNYAALRALIGERKEGIVIVSGRSTPADGGGGIFSWNGTSTEADNDSIVLAPTEGGNGRWERITDTGMASLTWFGGTNDAITNLMPLGTYADGLIVHIVDSDPTKSGIFTYDDTQSATDDGINIINGWVRVNDVNFTSAINMYGNTITNVGAGNPEVAGDVLNAGQINTIIETLVNEALIANTAEAVIVAGEDTYGFGTDITNAFIFITGGGDRGRLRQGTEYIVDPLDNTQIILTETFDANSVLVASFFEGVGPTVNPGILIKEFPGNHVLEDNDIDFTLKFTGANPTLFIPDTLVFQERFTCLIHASNGPVKVLTDPANTTPQIINILDPSHNGVIENNGFAALLGDNVVDNWHLTGDTRLIL